ncbi:MAG: GxxExxY protein [Bacteroidota bacterium]
MEPDRSTDQTAHLIIGAALEVHRTLGPGFLESVYEEALACELDERSIPFERQRKIYVPYKSRTVGEGRLDLLVDACVIVELKAIDAFAPIHTAKLISYLKATGLSLGLLINFNVPVLKDGIRRVVLTGVSHRSGSAVQHTDPP